MFSQSRSGVGRSAGRGREGVSQAQKTRRMGGGRADCFVSKKLLPPSFSPALENRGRKRRRLQPSLPSPNPRNFGVTHRRSKWEKCRSGRRTSVYQIKSHLQIGGGGGESFFPLLVWCGSWRLLVRRRRCRYAPRSSLWPPCGFGGGGGGFKSSLHRERLSSLEEWA